MPINDALNPLFPLVTDLFMTHASHGMPVTRDSFASALRETFLYLTHSFVGIHPRVVNILPQGLLFTRYHDISWWNILHPDPKQAVGSVKCLNAIHVCCWRSNCHETFVADTHSWPFQFTISWRTANSFTVSIIVHSLHSQLKAFADEFTGNTWQLRFSILLLDLYKVQTFSIDVFICLYFRFLYGFISLVFFRYLFCAFIWSG